MDFRKRFAIHFPSQHDFIDFDLPPRNRHGIVIYITFLEVRIRAYKFKVFRPVLEAATVLDDLLQTNSRPSCRTNCTLAPLETGVNR